MINLSNLIGGVVNIGPAVAQPVEALSWDITLGTAGTGLGQLILGRTSSSSEMIPEAVDHVGVVVFGYLYEYGDLGILKTAAPLQSNPESKYPVFNLRNREILGETEKSQDEFEEWVRIMNETDFQGSGYDVVTQSCVIWGIRACEFLGVPYPQNWDKVCNWAIANSKVASLIGGSGVNSRKVQIKAQASQAPKKVVNYIKKKFKRKRDEKDGESGDSSSGSTTSADGDGNENLDGEENGQEANTKGAADSDDEDTFKEEFDVDMLSDSVAVTRL